MKTPLKPTYEELEQRIAELEFAGKMLSKSCLQLMMNGLRDDDLWKSYTAIRDALVGKPNFHKKADRV